MSKDKKINIFILKKGKNMIIIEVKKNNIEQALKQYKLKIYKTKQLEHLRDRQEFEKKSVKSRKKRIKAVYIQKIKNQLSS